MCKSELKKSARIVHPPENPDSHGTIIGMYNYSSILTSHQILKSLANLIPGIPSIFLINVLSIDLPH